MLKMAYVMAGRRIAEKSRMAKRGSPIVGAAPETGLHGVATMETDHVAVPASQGFEAEARSAEARSAAITTEKTAFAAI